eukprot:UN25707
MTVCKYLGLLIFGPIILFLFLCFSNVYFVTFLHVSCITIFSIVERNEITSFVIVICLSRSIIQAFVSYFYYYPSKIRATFDLFLTMLFTGFFMYILIPKESDSIDYITVEDADITAATITLVFCIILNVCDFWVPTSRSMYLQSEKDLYDFGKIKNYHIEDFKEISHVFVKKIESRREQEAKGISNEYQSSRKDVETVVLVHGFGQTKCNWAEVIPKLTKKYNV